MNSITLICALLLVYCGQFGPIHASSIYTWPRPLFSQCVNHYDCGHNAFCAPYHKCMCKLGYAPKHDLIDGQLQSANCELFQCSYDYDCTAQFGTFTKCTATSGQQSESNKTCNCDYSFNAGNVYFDADMQTCGFLPESISKRLCYSDLQCDEGMYCYSKYEPNRHVHRECRCKFGHTQKHTNGQQCAPIECNSDAECQDYDNAQCTNRSCACKDNFELVDQVCVHSSTANVQSEPNKSRILVLISLGSLAIICTLCGGLYHRRFRVQTVQSNSNAIRMVNGGTENTNQLNGPVETIDATLPTYDEVVKDEENINQN